MSEHEIPTTDNTQQTLRRPQPPQIDLEAFQVAQQWYEEWLEEQEDYDSDYPHNLAPLNGIITAYVRYIQNRKI